MTLRRCLTAFIISVLALTANGGVLAAADGPLAPAALAGVPGSLLSTLKLADNTHGGPALANSDWFGVSVTVIGDLNGDGVPDLAIGANGDSTGGSQRGAVYVAFMHADGTIVSSTVKLASSLHGGPALADLDYFGTSVAGIGDLNHDGVPDLAIGADGDSNFKGAVYVAFMHADGTISSTVKLANNLNGGPALLNGDSFGFAVAPIGDLNHDGVPDLAIGALDDNTGGSARGAVYVAFMQPDGTISSTVKLADNTHGGPTLTNFNYFGSAVAAIGDLNHDGVPDLAIGAQGDAGGGTDSGAVYLAFMQADGTISSTVKLANNTHGGPSLADHDNFGNAVALIGDLNHDGVPDLAIGAPGDAGGVGRGAVYVAVMKADGTISSTVKLADNTNGGPALADNDLFGTAVAAIGDLNHDGVPDLAIGAFGDSTGGAQRGAVYVGLLQPGGTLGQLQSAPTTRLASGTHGGPLLPDSSYLGSAVTVIGDLNHDGVPDLAIGADGDAGGGNSRGAVYIARMRADGTISSTVKLADNTHGGPPLADFDFFGRSVAAIGDLNHDGVPDLAIGAYGDAGGGAVYIAFMHEDGTISSTVKLGSGIGGGPALTAGDGFGVSVAPIGDLNHDGVPDLAIGAYTDSTGHTAAGAVYIALMSAAGTISSTVKLASGTGGGPSLQADDLFGSALASLGDFNHDGVPDLAIGANADSSHGAHAGAVYVTLLKADGTISSTLKLVSGLNGGPALAASDFFGFSLAALGDVNHDGVPDLAIGAPSDHTSGLGRGAVYVAVMAADGTISRTVKLASGTNGGPVLANGDNFGFSLAALGDFNHDGVPDLASGAWRDSASGSLRGAVYVVPLIPNYPLNLPLVIR